MPWVNHQIVLASHADGLPRADNFVERTGEIQGCDAGHLVVRNHYLSVDPAQKGWMGTAQNYASARLGEPMRALAVGEVVESLAEGFREGDFVSGWFGWQEYAHVGPEAVQRILEPWCSPIRYALSVYGLNGLTAYIVLSDILLPAEGDTLLVSTAAGGVGSIVGQLASERGARVVGLTGSDDKVALCKSEYGYSAAINYKDADWLKQLAGACPDGIDKYFDMAGGWISDEVIALMNHFGIHAQVGTAAVASWDPVPQAPRRERVLLIKELTQKGFVIFNHQQRYAEAIAHLRDLLGEGKLNFREDIRDGLSAAPAALEELYQGLNRGKLLIRLVDETGKTTH